MWWKSLMVGVMVGILFVIFNVSVSAFSETECTSLGDFSPRDFYVEEITPESFSVSIYCEKFANGSYNVVFGTRGTNPEKPVFIVRNGKCNFETYRNLGVFTFNLKQVSLSDDEISKIITLVSSQERTNYVGVKGDNGVECRLGEYTMRRTSESDNVKVTWEYTDMKNNGTCVDMSSGIKFSGVVILKDESTAYYQLYSAETGIVDLKYIPLSTDDNGNIDNLKIPFNSISFSESSIHFVLARQVFLAGSMLPSYEIVKDYTVVSSLYLNCSDDSDPNTTNPEDGDNPMNPIVVSSCNVGGGSVPNTGKDGDGDGRLDDDITHSDYGIMTAIGCVPTNTGSLVGMVLRWAIGLGGGIAFLLMAFGGFVFMTSGGNPEKVKQGKEILTSAIAGLLFIIFSVFLLNLIGVKILQIPGFN